MVAPSSFRDNLQNVVWAHRNFQSALNLVQSLAVYSPKGSMILVVGASGVGKSTLLKQLQMSLVGSEPNWPNGIIPVTTTPICNDVQGLFSSKNFVLRLLGAVRHPFYGVHQRLGLSASGGSQELALEKIRLCFSEPHLWLALESAIEHRMTQFILLDEAQHLMKAGSERKAIDNLDCIKGLAERTGTIIILFGTFDILPIWNRSAQLNRRLHDVVLHRYFPDEISDVGEFARILETFSRVLPLDSKLSLIKHAEFIYHCTFGIIGEIVRLFVGAHARMTAEGKVAITLQMLRDAAHSQQKLQTLRRETTQGEKILNSNEARLSESSCIKVVVPRGRTRPGIRKPTRDPVPAVGTGRS